MAKVKLPAVTTPVCKVPIKRGAVEITNIRFDHRWPGTFGPTACHVCQHTGIDSFVKLAPFWALVRSSDAVAAATVGGAVILLVGIETIFFARAVNLESPSTGFIAASHFSQNTGIDSFIKLGAICTVVYSSYASTAAVVHWAVWFISIETIVFPWTVKRLLDFPCILKVAKLTL